MVSVKDSILSILIFVSAVHTAAVSENLTSNNEGNGTNITAKSNCVGVVAACRK
jgi:hypothetical protein